MRLVALITVLLLWLGPLVLTGSRESRDPVEAGITFGTDARPPSPLGAFPPTEIVEPSERKRLDIRIPGRYPDGMTTRPQETRTAPAGAYVTQFGETLFLTQRPRSGRMPSWTLQVPHAATDSLRILAARVGESPALGIERKEEFTRLAWSEGSWTFVLFDVEGGSTLEDLLLMADSLD